jgi:hypothetical protein
MRPPYHWDVFLELWEMSLNPPPLAVCGYCEEPIAQGVENVPLPGCGHVFHCECIYDFFHSPSCLHARPTRCPTCSKSLVSWEKSRQLLNLDKSIIPLDDFRANARREIVRQWQTLEVHREPSEVEQYVRARALICDMLTMPVQHPGFVAQPIPGMASKAVKIAITQMMLSSVTKDEMSLTTWVWLSEDRRKLLNRGRIRGKISNEDVANIRSFDFGPTRYKTTLNQIFGQPDSRITEIMVKMLNAHKTVQNVALNPEGCTMVAGKVRVGPTVLSPDGKPPQYDVEGDGFQLNIWPIEHGIVRFELEEFDFGMLVRATVVDQELFLLNSRREKMVIQVKFQG